MTARTVDKCLDEIDRLRAKHVATQSHLWASEFLLAQVVQLLPKMIADSAVTAAHCDALMDDITALLAEQREHPGTAVTASEGEAGAVTATGESS